MTPEGNAESARGDLARDAANEDFWADVPALSDYTHRELRPAEVLLMLRYREDLAGRVLEVGCGAGRVSGYLTEIAADAHGIDVSAQMVGFCRRMYPAGTFTEADMREVDRLEAAPFDAAFATFNVLDALGHADRERTLDALHRALVPGGLLLMSSHNRAHAPQVIGPVREAVLQLRSRSPRGVLRSLRNLPAKAANHRRLRRREVDVAGYAILNDPAHDYSLLNYYIRREDQERQLREHGFEVLECLDLDGNVLGPGEQAEDCAELHYVARRSG